MNHVPKIWIGERLGKQAFKWKDSETGTGRSKIIQNPNSPAAIEKERQDLIASFLAGGAAKVKRITQPLVDASYKATAGTQLYDFIAEVPGKNETHKICLQQRVERILQKAKIRHAAGITESKITKVIRELRCSVRKPGKEEAAYPLLSERSRHHHRRAIKQFCKWLARHGFIAKNPLTELQCPKVRVQVNRRDRFQSDELAKLLSTVESSPNIRLYHGATRAVLYKLAAFTGLRKSELATLTPESFNWKEQVVVVREGQTKNDTEARQPLPPELVPLLQEFVKRVPPGKPLFPKLADKQVAWLLQRDMKEAKIPVDTAEGTRTFHSLRNTFICLLLEQTRNNIALCQKLARHADVATTLSYARFTTEDARQAIAALPGLLVASETTNGTGV